LEQGLRLVADCSNIVFEFIDDGRKVKLMGGNGFSSVQIAGFWLSNSVSMALGIDGWWLSWRDAMVCIICSTAIAIVVFS